MSVCGAKVPWGLILSKSCKSMMNSIDDAWDDTMEQSNNLNASLVQVLIAHKDHNVGVLQYGKNSFDADRCLHLKANYLPRKESGIERLLIERKVSSNIH